MLIKIVKDNFFSTKKWFIEMDDGYKGRAGHSPLTVTASRNRGGDSARSRAGSVCPASRYCVANRKGMQLKLCALSLDM